MATFDSPIGVLGFGTMGSGIAQVAAAGGYNVIVLDNEEAALTRGQDRLEGFLADGVRRGKVTEDDATAVAGRVSGTLDPDDLAGCTLIIESTTEERQVKQEVLRSVSALVAPDVVIATNTSSLSITALGADVAAPERFAGLHFFNPAPLMGLVEVIPGLATDDTTVQRLCTWATEVGKEPVVVKDQPGFLVNAVLMPYLNQAITEFDEGLASGEDIDTAIRLGLGYRKGPLELLDLIGLDTHLHATSRAFEDTADPRFAAPPLLQRLVASGRLGAKTSSGLRQQGEM